jgi:hypothetical protein
VLVLGLVVTAIVLGGRDPGRVEENGESDEARDPPPKPPDPEIVVEGPEEGALFGPGRIPVSGRIVGPEGCRLTVNEWSVTVEDGSFSDRVPASDELEFVLLSTEGEELARATRSLRLDVEGPVFEVERRIEGRTSPLRIEGTVRDENPLDYVLVDGERHDLEEDGSFRIPIPLDEGQRRSVELVARDRVENRSEVTVVLVRPAPMPRLTVTSPRPGAKVEWGRYVQVVGRVDPEVVVRVLVGGHPIEFEPDGSFSAQWRYWGKDWPVTLVVTAVDRAGREVSEEIPLN